MRIAQIMAGAAQGGAELFFERMSLALAAAGDTVLPLIRSEPRRMTRLTASGLAPEGFRFGGPLDPVTKPALGRAMRDFRPNVAMAWMSRAAYHAPRGDWTLIGRLGGYYNLKYFQRCDHLVGNTHDIVRWLAEQGWPKDRAHYLPNFVTDFADTPPADRAALGVPAGAPMVVALGRLHAVKGFDTLIRATATLAEAHLVIAGEGPERGNLESLIAEHRVADRVHLAGWREDAGALLRAADLFVSSSRHEPLGNMVLEAFSAGCPVVAAAAEGPLELITHGTEGLLVPIDDEAALAGAIAGALRDAALAAGLATAGRARFEAEFAETPVVAAWQDLLGRLAR